MTIKPKVLFFLQQLSQTLISCKEHAKTSVFYTLTKQESEADVKEARFSI